jgi:hypothetical protein
MAELNADPTIGPPPSHPEFTSYMTSGWGPGASPYKIAELGGFADTHLLTDRLNSFEETSTWGSPTLDGLSSTLQEAARTNATVFIRALPDLVGAKNAFRQAIIRGLQQAWDAKEQSQPCNWEEGWEQLITFFEQLVAQPATDQGYQHKWLLAGIADCLRSGTQQDEHAYTPILLPRSQAIIDALLQLPGETTLADDPMFTAINTPKGRAIEALFSHALRVCRVADQATGNHTDAWVQLQPISGLAYAAFTQRIYEHLLNGDIINRALHYDLKGREAREKLLGRIAVGESRPSNRRGFRPSLTAGTLRNSSKLRGYFGPYAKETSPANSENVS